MINMWIIYNIEILIILTVELRHYSLQTHFHKEIKKKDKLLI